MEVFGGKLLLNYDGGFNADTLFVYDGNQWGYFNKQNVSQKKELRAYTDCLLMTNRYNTFVYDLNFNEVQNIYSPGGSIEPLSSAFDSNGNFWIGDTKRGLIKTSDGWNNRDIKPNGTASNNVFELHACGEQVWIATGGHASNWSKRYMREGVARFDGYWTILNYTTLPDFDNYTDFVCTATNPKDPSVTYVGTWGSGILKFKDNELVEVYNADNSTLEYWVQDPNLINISGLAFDSHGNLWVANTGATKLLSMMEPNGTWHSFNLGGSLSGIDIGTLLIDNNDYKWIIRRGGEVLVLMTMALSTTLPTTELSISIQPQETDIWLGQSTASPSTTKVKFGLVLTKVPAYLKTQKRFSAEVTLMPPKSVCLATTAPTNTTICLQAPTYSPWLP
jgi:ligand-binding sensor domain-containing protein